MVNSPPHDPFTPRSIDGSSDEEEALRHAREVAVAELNRMREQAAVEASTSVNFPNYSMHKADGIGTYVIPRRTGWKPLLDIIHDPVPNIDFSANIYPAFDGVIGEHFQSPYLLDPLHEKYESYESLRDNLAAVRNFLLQSYYASPPPGMTAVKAEKALEEIAIFIGQGLDNNYLYRGVLPNHKFSGPHIDLSKARRGGGEGAQYIYEKILEHQRHSDWLKPFAPVMALFGGKPLPDWKLPGAGKTHFTDYFEKDILPPGAQTATVAGSAIAAATAQVAQIDQQLTQMRDAKSLTLTAADLDSLGNHLVFTAQHMDEGVAHLEASVRRDAVEIAKDILRKLKVSIGGKHVKDGLQMKPSEDVATLGAIKGVVTVYERLVAWARGNNDAGIMQHPSVMAATQAIGQMGYLAKMEARRMAGMAGNQAMVANLDEQLQRMPQAFRPREGATFGSLLDAIEQGMQTILERTHEVGHSGTSVRFSRDNQAAALSDAPTAGLGKQIGAEEIAERNAAIAKTAQLAAVAETQRSQAGMNAHAQQQQKQQQQQQQQQQRPQQQRSGATVGRNHASQPQPQSTSSGSGTRAQAPQQRASQRNANNNMARERERRLREWLRQQQQLEANMKAAKSAAKAAAKASSANKAKHVAQSIDPHLLKGFHSAFDMSDVDHHAPVITSGKKIDPKSIKASKGTTMGKAKPGYESISANSSFTSALPGSEEDQHFRNLYHSTQGPNGRGGRGY